MYSLQRNLWVPHPLDAVFAFFCDVRNLEAITPPWLHFRILSQTPVDLREGVEIRYQLAVHGIELRWTSRITNWNPPHAFSDEQVSGPYRSWSHTHSFVAENGGTRMFDSVRYELPFGILGKLAHMLRVRGDLEKIFDYRAQWITSDKFLSSRRPAIRL